MRFGVREVIFLVVLLVVPVASYFYVFKPRNEEIKQAQHEVEIKQAKLEKLREVKERIKNIDLAIEQGRAAIELVEAKLPSAMDVEVMLQDVWELAATAKLEVKSVQSEKAVAAANYMEQPLRVEMIGSFDGFYQFLMGLENLPRITRVHDLNLERQGDMREDVQYGLMKASFTLSIYFKPLDLGQ